MEPAEHKNGRKRKIIIVQKFSDVFGFKMSVSDITSVFNVELGFRIEQSDNELMNM